MSEPEHDEWDDQHKPKEQVEGHHEHVKRCLLSGFRQPCQNGHAEKVNSISAQYSKAEKHDPEEWLQLWADGWYVDKSRASDWPWRCGFAHF